MGLGNAEHGPLHALESVLGSIESVRNGRALYLLLCTFAVAGLTWSGLRGRLGDAGAGTDATVVVWLAATFFAVYYGTFAAGIVLLDEARGSPERTPWEALRAALATGHRLLLVVLGVLLVALLPLGLVTAALWAAARWPAVDGLAVRAAVTLGVPAVGLVMLVLATLVGPLAAPAAWSGWGVRRTLGFIGRQVRDRLVHAVMLSAAVSLLSAAMAALVSFVVLIGGRLVLTLASGVFGLDIAHPPVLAAMLGTGLRIPAGTAPFSALTQSALDAAGLVFALGLVVPGAVYLRGLCELFLALQRQDEAAGRECQNPRH